MLTQTRDAGPQHRRRGAGASRVRTHLTELCRGRDNDRRSDPTEGIQLMGFTDFTWQYCPEHEEWDSPGRPPTRRPSGTCSTPTHCGGPPSPGAATRWTRHRPGSAAGWSFPPEDREIYG